MRRAPLLALALVLPLAAAGPASAANRKHSRTRTPVRIKSPAPANATVAGFELDLVKVHRKKRKRAKASAALAHIAAGLPKNVSIYAVLAKQKRSDRVKGVLVAAHRASAVATSAARHKAVRRLRINLRHSAVPKGYRLKLKLAESDNVLGRHHPLRCGAYFKASDLAGAQRLGGPGLPGITLVTIVRSACASARKSRAPYATLGEFRYALNASAGALPFVLDSQFPNEVDGNASFNYPVKAFGVLADRGHSFTACGFGGGTCVLQTVAHANNYAFFTLSTPAPAGTQLPFALALSPGVSKALPFEFFGVDESNHRIGPLLTSGP
jgi:hypothetical protein